MRIKHKRHRSTHIKYKNTIYVDTWVKHDLYVNLATALDGYEWLYYLNKIPVNKTPESINHGMCRDL